MQEPWVRSLGWEDPLEEEMATHSSIFAWRIPMERGAWWAIVHGIAESGTTEWIHAHKHGTTYIFSNFMFLFSLEKYPGVGLLDHMVVLFFVFLGTSILKEINPEFSMEGLMLKLKLQYFGYLMWKADSRKDPDAGKDWRQKEKGVAEDEMVRWHHRLSGHDFEWTLETVKDREAWHAAVHGVAKSRTRLSNERTVLWTEPYSSPWWLRQFTFPPAVHEGSLFSYFFDIKVTNVSYQKRLCYFWSH